MCIRTNMVLTHMLKICDFRSNRLQSKPRPLENVVLYLAAKPENSQFLEDWKSILTIADASLVKKISVNSGTQSLPIQFVTT